MFAVTRRSIEESDAVRLLHAMSNPMSAEDESPRAVSAVVVTWNAADLLRECLDSLLAQSAPGWELTIVVVDNGSSDGTTELVRAHYPSVRLVALPTNTGFAHAANRGIAESNTPFVVLVNNDAVCEPGFIAAILAPFDDDRAPDDQAPDDAKLAAVTGRILLAHKYRPLQPTEPDRRAALVGFDGRRWVVAEDGDYRGVELVNSTGTQVTRSGNGRDRDWLRPATDAAPSSDVFGFCGGAVALRRAALDDVGLFEDSLFLYYEDTDLSWRLRRRGWRIAYAHDAVVRHRHAASSGTASEFFLRHNERNRIVVAIRNAPLPVVARAIGRWAGHAARDVAHGHGVGRHFSTAGHVVRHAFSLVKQRKAIEAASTVRRRDLARHLVADDATER